MCWALKVLSLTHARAHTNKQRQTHGSPSLTNGSSFVSQPQLQLNVYFGIKEKEPPTSGAVLHCKTEIFFK